MVKIVDGFPEELRKCHRDKTKDINKDGVMINHYLQVRDLVVIYTCVSCSTYCAWISYVNV